MGFLQNSNSRLSAVTRLLYTKNSTSGTDPQRLSDKLGVQVLVEESGSLGILTLDRPRSLNALNYDVCATIGNKLKEWDHLDHHIKAILIKGSGRAFSSGGDLKTIAHLYNAGHAERVMQFFEANYKMDYTICQLQKPLIALMDGITFGGGCGLSMYASYKIATENTEWAMPETQIGYIPDCGSSYVFHKQRYAGDQWGLLHALTGTSVSRSRLQALGLATHHIPSDKWISIETQLRKDASDITTTFAPFSKPIEATLQDIVMDELASKCCADVESVEEIVDRLQAIDRRGLSTDNDRLERALYDKSLHTSIVDKAVEQTLRDLQSASPLSMQITFRLQRTVNENDTLGECMRREYGIVRKFAHLPNDFVEGIFAKLIRRDVPKWIFPTLQHVDMKLVDEFFENISNDIDLNVRPTLLKTELAEVIKRTALTVMHSDGVVTDIVYYGTNTLAKPVRRGDKKFTDAMIFDLKFCVKPSVVYDIEDEIRFDERILRWVVRKQKATAQAATKTELSLDISEQRH